MAELIVGAVVFMVVTRHQLRGIYLALAARRRAGDGLDRSGRALALFLVVFVICVALTAYALVKAARDRPQPGEDAA